jgi:DNA-directed RNA polymerase subunit alpha
MMAKKAQTYAYEMPDALVVDTETRTHTYAKMTAEPFEAGYGHTLGNSLRRVLLSSLEGAAITSIKIDGVPHEFTTIPGVFEDVTHIVLNLKKVLFGVTSKKPFSCELKAKGEGNVTAGDIKTPAGIEILNPEHHLFSMDKNANVRMELMGEVGMGYRPADDNKKSEQPVGVIALDSLFSPIVKVKYLVEAARVGMKTDYDRLVLEVWTDGRIDPVAATVQSTQLLLDHLQIFRNVGDPMYLEAGPAASDAENADVIDIPPGAEDITLEELGLSKRTVNSLYKSKIQALNQLLQLTEQDLLALKSFGHKALMEVKSALEDKELSLHVKPATEQEIAQMIKKSAKKK